MCHPEDLANSMQIEIVALELESRSPRRHFQVRNLCKRVEYFLGNAIAEVGGVLVVAQIFERKHCDALPGNSGGRFVASRTGTIRSGITTEEKQPNRHNRADGDHVNP